MRKKMYRPDLKHARDPRAVRTRDALRQAFLKLLDRRSLDQITILDICETSGVGYTTFFRHHPTKESLLNDIAADQMGYLVELSHSVAATSDTRAGLVALCNYVHAHRHLWSTLLTGGAAGAMKDEFMRLSKQLSKTGARAGAWPPAEIATILIVSSTIELLSWWLRAKKPLSVEQIAEIFEIAIISPTVDLKRIKVGRVTRAKRTR